MFSPLNRYRMEDVILTLRESLIIVYKVLILCNQLNYYALLSKEVLNDQVKLNITYCKYTISHKQKSCIVQGGQLRM